MEATQLAWARLPGQRQTAATPKPNVLCEPAAGQTKFCKDRRRRCLLRIFRRLGDPRRLNQCSQLRRPVELLTPLPSLALLLILGGCRKPKQRLKSSTQFVNNPKKS